MPPPAPGRGARVNYFAIFEAVSVMLFAGFWMLWAQWIYLSPGISQISGDFVSFWTAGQLVLDGRAADAYREAAHMALQDALHHDAAHWLYLAFFYPPFFLLLCAPFALIPYLPALGLWLASTCAAYIFAIRALAPERRVWVLFLGYPAVLVNAGFGQNGFLSAALFAAAARWLDHSPIRAGICIGCLAYKPQLGIIIPLALAAAGRWRCFAAASATVITLALAATLMFGPEIWPAFLANTTDVRRWMEVTDPNYLAKWISIYGAIRLHDGPVPLAYAAQALVTLIAAICLLRTLARHTSTGAATIAAIAACVPFCSPFLLEYDLVILAIPMAWLLTEALRTGFRPYERLALLAAWSAPAVFKIAALNNAAKLVVPAAAALLLATLLRRITRPPCVAPGAASAAKTSAAPR